MGRVSVALVGAFMLAATPWAARADVERAAPVPPSYVPSGQISPFLVSSHLQLALDQLRAARQAMRASHGEGEEGIARDLAPTRQALANAADELGLARMATADPDQIARIDEALSQLDDLRDALSHAAISAPRRLRDLEGDVLALHHGVREQIERTEPALAQADGRGAVR